MFLKKHVSTVHLQICDLTKELSIKYRLIHVYTHDLSVSTQNYSTGNGDSKV